MVNKITSQEVASQFAKAIVLFLEWLEDRNHTDQPIENKVSKDDDIRLLTAEQVAEILNISKSQIYHMMQRGEIPSVRIGGSVRVRPSDLEHFISSNLKKVV